LGNAFGSYKQETDGTEILKKFMIQEVFLENVEKNKGISEIFIKKENRNG